MERYLPSFDFHINDLGTHSSLEEINHRYKVLSLQVLFRLFYAVFHEEILLKEFEHVVKGLYEIYTTSPTEQLGKAMLRYLIRSTRAAKMNKKALNEKILYLPQNEKAMFKSLYDEILEEGMEKGIEKSVKQCLKKGMSVAEVADLLELTEQQVEAFANAPY